MGLLNNDLISRSAHIDKFTAEAKKIAANDKDFAQALMYVVTCLDAAPAVDAVEVVRCRDCVYDGLPTCFTCYIEQHEMIFLNHDPEFFCGAGERKDADDGNEA